MGWRFRKSIKLAPGVRLNLGSKSNSVTFGGKHFRRTVGSTGRVTDSMSVPGTGLSYSETSRKGKKKHRNAPLLDALAAQQEDYTDDDGGEPMINRKLIIAGIVVGILVVYSIFGGGKTASKETETTERAAPVEAAAAAEPEPLENTEPSPEQEAISEPEPSADDVLRQIFAERFEGCEVTVSPGQTAQFVTVATNIDSGSRPAGWSDLRERLQDAVDQAGGTDVVAASILAADGSYLYTIAGKTIFDAFEKNEATEKPAADVRYILNTSTMKIHNEWCPATDEIAAENYQITRKSLDELYAEGYTKCAKKGDWN